MKKPTVDKNAKPLAHETRRVGTVVKLPSSMATGTGSGYKNHVPLTLNLRLNDTTTASVSSLLDTGASLSIIDSNLLEKLGGQPQGESMTVHGIGDVRTLGWASITIFIESTDQGGNTVHLEVQQDFHVLPLFSPGLLLGLDFISAHAVSLTPVAGKASIDRYSFPVVERVAGPYAQRPELHASSDVVLPPGQYTWVPVYAGCLAPGVDYTIHPRFSFNNDQSVQLFGPTGLLTHRPTHHVLLGNFGSVSYVVEKGRVVADAVAARFGDMMKEGGEAFTLDVAENPPAPVAPSEDADCPADPINPFDDDDAGPSDLTREAQTVVVDGHYRVGVDDDGTPPKVVVDLLRRHSSAFALDGRPGRITDPEMGEMPIELTPDASLRPEAPRRASPEKRRAMDTAIDQLLEWDVIEPSSSPVSFPVLMVKQRDKWRFCVDYRQLNTVTVSDRYPLPTIDSIFQTLTGKRIFSSLDAIRGYHQMGVRESDRWKTAFVCHRGLFQYKTVPFGLKNAPSVFQRLMDRILGSLRWSHAVVYIDDIVVASDSMDEHVKALDTLLTNATRVGLKFSPSKCTFAVPSLVLLGRKVSGAGVAVWKDRAKAVSALARPTTLRELYHVLGLFGYYRAFIPKYAELAAPLTQLTKGWRYEADAAGRYRLINTEGSVMSADRVPVAWEAAQQRSFETLKAAIAHPPVLAHPDSSRPFVLYVDASKDAFAAILHQVFDDPMSPRRKSVTAAALPLMPTALLPLTIARERWSSWLRSDRSFAPIMRRLEDGESDDTWALWDGVLVRRVDDRLALPEAGIAEVLKPVHDRKGHFGFWKTYLAVSRHFWRPSLSVAVRAWVKHCGVCHQTKRLLKVGELDVDHDPQFPCHTISVDLVLGLPRTRSGNDAILAILDVFSRLIMLHPCSSTITAEGIAAMISDRILRWGWRPRRIVSDSEARMTGSVMSALADSLQASLTPSPPHHQQANAVERSVQTLQRVLQSMGVGNSVSWDQQLVPTVELAMNSTPSLTTGFRPFDLVFIHHPEVVHSLFDSSESERALSFPDHLAVAEERLQDARQAMASARLHQKQRYDGRHQPLPDLRVGDSVYIRLRDRPIPGLARSKTDPKKAGPYSVLEVLSPHRVRLDLGPEASIGDEFSIEQLDLVPRSTDPFLDQRDPVASAPPMLSDGDESVERFEDVDVADGSYLPDSSVEVPPSRPRRAPGILRDFQIGVAMSAESKEVHELLKGPLYKGRVVELDGVSTEFRERPVAFLSRLTSISERKMVASELELCCLAWAFSRWAHWLEGTFVTVVTDHSPLGQMLNSTAPITYGPTIARCRALLLPHLTNIRFVHRAGVKHTNADALSRLPPAS
ncbi:hypothetical protein CF319_g3494 [Tilletia indica]|nr:hypothetical protein CF319_g3494 [Tilletia indica]